MSEPEGVVLYEARTDQLLTEPTKFLVLTKDGFRWLQLRVARGVVSDLPCNRVDAEACD